MKHLTPGLLLTLTLAFAATANAQNENITIDFDVNSMTGHEINDAILQGEQWTGVFYLDNLANDWECDSGTPPNCTLTEGKKPRETIRIPEVIPSPTYDYDGWTQVPNAPPTDDPLIINTPLIDKELEDAICKTAASISLGGAAVWMFTTADQAPKVVKKVFPGKDNKAARQVVKAAIRAIARTPTGLVVTVTVTTVAGAVVIIAC